MSDWALAMAAGVVVGAVAAWLAVSARLGALLTELRAQIALLSGSLQARERQAAELQQQIRIESEQKVVAETRLREGQLSLEDQKRLLEEAKKHLADAFGALASEALRGNREEFLALARTTFETLHADAKGDLETRKTEVEALVQPLRDSLNRFEREVQEIERARRESYGTLVDQVKNLSQVASSLNHALRTPDVRGRWGEMTLHRVAELAGMSEHCDFTEQESLFGEAGRQRPDMIVRLPGERCIAVDAKAPLQAFLDAAAAATEEDRKSHLVRHGRVIREHMNKLGGKSYWEQFDAAPDFVILFLPGEHFFSTALEHERTLIEDGIESRVVLATPTTLIALLRAVAYGWRQEKLAQNAQEVSTQGKELYDRIGVFLEHFRASGAALDRAVENYNRAVGSLEGRVLISARRLKDLGAATGEDLLSAEVIERAVRQLQLPE